ncbi:MAG: hypothetical protein IPK74_28690 [Deltaproteobacteria bacterium]|nr:hypothetical protein [Deltaproteobacteria bacterium]
MSASSGRELRSLTQPVDTDLAFSPQPHADDPAALRRYEETYAWDAVGNIVELRHVASGGNFTRRYAYAPGGNRLLRNSAPGEAAEPFSHSYSYDEHGNMTSMPHLAAMAWDHADRLQHCDLGGGGEVWFVYDASGARVRKVQRNASGSRVRERVYLGEFELYRERAANDVAPELERQTLHVGDGTRRLCLVETLTVDDGEPVAAPVSVPRFQHGNHLDSASLELDGDAAVISYEEFHPFGTTSYAANDSAVEVSAKRYRYIGKERDEETGLYHLGARYYAAWLGRWTAADPTGLADGVNRYAYCRGSPVTLRDTSGSAAETPGLVVERALLQARHTAIEAQLLALDARDAAATASRRQFSEAMARQRIEVGGLQAAVQLQRRYTASRGWLDTVTRMPTLTELGDAIAEDIALRPFAYAPGIGPAIAATHHTHDAGDAWSRRQYLEASGHVAGALGEAALAYLDIAAPAAGVAEHGAERVITLFSNGKKVVRSAAVRTAEGNASREAERVAAEGEAFRLARHGDHPSPRPGGAQSHHGVMSAWMKKHHPAYNPDEAPAILMSAEAHARTFGVYNRWRAEMKAEMGGVFDWAKVSEDQMRRLSEKMFDAAGVPRQVRADYWRWFERMKGALHRGR